MAALRAVLLDLYDTLAWVDADDYDAHLVALARLAGVESARFRAAWDATGPAATLGRLDTTEARARAALTALGVDADAATLAGCEDRFQDEAARLYDGVPEALAALRARGLRLAVIGNATAAVRDVPARLGLTSLLDAIVFSFAVGSAKPNAAIYRAACAHLGVRLAECLFAGDGGSGELDGAAALGMVAVWVDQPRNATWGAMTSSVYHHRIAAIADLPALVDRLSAAAAG